MLGATGTNLTWDVHKVLRPHKGKPDHDNCYRCGKAGNKAAMCRFRDAQGHVCGKTGHIKAVCRSVQKTLLKSKSVPRLVRMESFAENRTVHS